MLHLPKGLLHLFIVDLIQVVVDFEVLVNLILDVQFPDLEVVLKGVQVVELDGLPVLEHFILSGDLLPLLEQPAYVMQFHLLLHLLFVYKEPPVPEKVPL